ncbi:extended synaptotagmin-2-like [Phalaenopsis equestris]|uniref:extended synaptotagmin-2-like n=1 Tax=Phalaenopsis equestris TaxID=78828 RepID=UPI0009E2CED1|nr:extended synaptotagmin-2-like [Phalaenopsis equestris]
MLSLRDFVSRVSILDCPFKLSNECYGGIFRLSRRRRRRRVLIGFLSSDACRRSWKCLSVCRKTGNLNSGLVHPVQLSSAKRSARAQRLLVGMKLSGELGGPGGCREDAAAVGSEHVRMESANFTSYVEDPLVDKLRSQLGVIHPIPSPPINRNIVGFFVLFFFIGVMFDKLWTSRRSSKSVREDRAGTWPQVPTSFSMFLEKDLQRKESVEWVNMVLGKLWKVYRPGIENWIIGLLQPVIDNLRKPSYVQRVEIKQFSLGDEPLSVRNVERRTSRRVNDLQYHIGLRYTGGARMLLSLSLKFGIIVIVVPVGVRNFDIDGELWVKLRLIATEPYVGAVSWAFVSLPRIKIELSPFRLFNLMGVPVVSMFLKKLLTEDLPGLFVRPRKIVLDFQKGKALGPVTDNLKADTTEEGNRDFVGELSVTLVDARKLAFLRIGKTDPYVVLRLGNQVIRSKKNSQTTVIGPPGEPIWNQDFILFVANPRKQRLQVEVIDSFGFSDFRLGAGEVELVSLQDTVPSDRIVTLRGGWRFFGRQSAGEILLRLTYKAYVEDEEDDWVEKVESDSSDDEVSDYDQASNLSGERGSSPNYARERESFMNVLAELLVSEEFQGIVASETVNPKTFEESYSPRSTTSTEGVPNAENSPLKPLTALVDSNGLVLVWLSVITSIALLIAFNVGGSGYFNP